MPLSITKAWAWKIGYGDSCSKARKVWSQGLSMTELLPVRGSGRQIHIQELWKEFKAQGEGLDIGSKCRAMILEIESRLEFKQKQVLPGCRLRRTE